MSFYDNFRDSQVQYRRTDRESTTTPQQQSLWPATLMRLQLLDLWMSCDGTKPLPPETK